MLKIFHCHRAEYYCVRCETNNKKQPRVQYSRTLIAKQIVGRTVDRKFDSTEDFIGGGATRVDALVAESDALDVEIAFPLVADLDTEPAVHGLTSVVHC